MVSYARALKPDAPASRNVGRILQAATPLLLTHGVRKVTMAEIARAAGVGKGTAYQYWSTKEDLILDLAVREAVACLESMADVLDADPDRQTVGSVLRLVIDTALEHPVVTRILQRTDDQLLSVIADRSWSRDTFAASSPPALCGALLPPLRAHGLVNTDMTPADQTFAAVSMLLGFFTTVTATDRLTANDVPDPGAVVEHSVQAVLGVRTPPGKDGTRAAVAEVTTILRTLCTDLTAETAEQADRNN